MKDKNLLFQEWNIQELPLCVNREVSTTDVVLGFSYGGKAWEGCQGQAESSSGCKECVSLNSIGRKSGLRVCANPCGPMSDMLSDVAGLINN